MNKKGLIDVISEKTGMNKKDSTAALNAVTETISGALREGEAVQIVGFGTFLVQRREEHKGKNPATNEEIVIPASNLPKFKPGKALKELCNQ